MDFKSKLRFLVAVTIFMFSNVQPSGAENLDLYEGTWKQVKSNADECSQCTITIKRNGKTLQVVANNGWSAVVRSAPKRFAAELPSIQGDGVWQNSGKARPLKIALVHDEGELQVLLLIAEQSRPRTIAATFRK